MADISMCLNHKCPSKLQCHRYTAIPTEYWQAYAIYDFDETGKCGGFWGNEKYAKRNVNLDGKVQGM